MNRIAFSLTVTAGLALAVIPARAIPIDGQLDPEYGAALSIQTTQTSRGDTPEDSFFGSELDGAYGYVAADVLYLLIAGNLNRYLSEPLVLPNQLQLYIDVGPGGQNTLSGSNPSAGFSVNLQTMAGLRFDADFAPDYWFCGARELSGSTPFNVSYAELPSGGGGAGYYLGSASIGGPGTLSGSGAFNPFGVLATIDISNVAGVTGGCGVASGAGVAVGVEFAIPLAAIGSPAGPVKVCALIASIGDEGQVSNQVLGPVPPGTCAFGSASGVDFSTVAGAQHFVIDPTTPAVRSTWGKLKALYR
jgi:hypothetical protein